MKTATSQREEQRNEGSGGSERLPQSPLTHPPRQAQLSLPGRFFDAWGPSPVLPQHPRNCGSAGIISLFSGHPTRNSPKGKDLKDLFLFISLCTTRSTVTYNTLIHCCVPGTVLCSRGRGAQKPASALVELVFLWGQTNRQVNVQKATLWSGCGRRMRMKREVCMHLTEGDQGRGPCEGIDCRALKAGSL